ncbi:glycosyltransferase family 2 protein [Pseudoalteromonas sp. KS88]|uniref:glycosyltransferase family 2 protein n=1 Tax=Pseudoalteromonas sp. KS88 TaxID=2109918 RepID=UPI0010815718|nr:glycosyltransferase family A protein [Pseudoalteromonas sp. KS88]TGE79852.1 glycosyltransferase family 2 protein [Pseudoalteromonas sp. KS88]
MESAVIITTKDRVEFLVRAVNSVFSQSLLPEELIVIDDNSDKELPQNILSAFQQSALQKGVAFTYIYNSEPKGGNYSRNLGVRSSSSELIHFLDDDDLWLKDKVKEQVKIFTENTRIGLVYTGKQFVNSANLDRVIRKSKNSNRENSIWKGNYIGSTSGVALKRAIFEKVDGFDPLLKSMQDFDLWVRVLKVSDALWDCQHNLVYTVHASNNKQITSNVDKHKDTIAYLREKYREEINSLPKDVQKVYLSRLEHVIARAYRTQGSFKFIKYALKSLQLHFSLRTLALFLNIK